MGMCAPCYGFQPEMEIRLPMEHFHEALAFWVLDYWYYWNKPLLSYRWNMSWVLPAGIMGVGEKDTIFKMIKYGLWMVHSWKSVPVSSILTNVKTVVFRCQEQRDTYVVYQLDLRPETKWPEPSGAPLPWWPGIPLDHLGSKHEFIGLSCDIAWQGNWSCKVFTNEPRQKETLQLVSGNYSIQWQNNCSQKMS